MNPLKIRAIANADIRKIKIFTDENIGENYYNENELLASIEKSTDQGVMCSFVLVDEKDNVFGLRLAYPPGKWQKGKGSKLRPDLWKTSPEKTGYFQSLFVSDQARGQGWGPQLSEKSFHAFRQLGVEAIVTHAWRESPENSSVRYLKKMGFESIAIHQDYWVDVDYECIRDGKPCHCSAEEMILYVKK